MCTLTTAGYELFSALSLRALRMTAKQEPSDYHRFSSEFFYMSHRERLAQLHKFETNAFELFCDARSSKTTLAMLLGYIFILTIYIYSLGIAYARKKWFFEGVAIAYFVIMLGYFAWMGAFHRKDLHLSLSYGFAANFSAIYSTLGLGLFLIARVLNGDCTHINYTETWGCNPEQGSHSLPQELVFALLFFPVMISTAFKAVKIECVVTSWFVAVLCVVVAVGLADASQTVPLLVFYVPVSLMVLYENYRQNIIVFLMFQKKKKLMEENKVLAEEAQTELRFMIANMAHDLKTPLAAFMNGIEIMSKEINDIRRSVTGELNVHFEAIADNIKNLFNVNSFMTMTVNRCIDYMKASRGIKLEPRFETIYLQEVLSMPLNCMRDLQSRIAIHQNPIPPSVCLHIITDLQWFQENLFCLISNAVKYSSTGHITVSVNLINASYHLITSARLKPHSRRLTPSPKSMLSTVAERDKETSTSEHMERYTFIDNFQITSEATAPEGDQVDPVDTTIASESETSRLDRMESGGVRGFLPRKKKVRVYCEANGSNSDIRSSMDSRASYTTVASEVAENNFLLIEVEDTGIGISDEVKASLFTPFKQAQRRAGGTGLGLYSLAKRVDALGGYYGVCNRHDGKQGSVFWFAIPYRPDYSHVNHHVRNNSFRILEADVSGTDSSKSKNSQSSLDPSNSALAGVNSLSPDTVPDLTKSPSPVPMFPQKGKLRILLVDDSPTILKMTSNLLKRQGHVVDEEVNGADALTRLEKAHLKGVKYDIMLIDLNMPVMDGLEATRRLRELEKGRSPKLDTPDVPRHQIVFAFSANSDRGTMAEALEAGADDFISKPFSIQTFSEKIEQWSEKIDV